MSKYIKLFDTHSDYEDFVGGGGMLKPNVSHCVQENEVHYKPIPNFNGHEYVDLGLPSGKMWAKYNVGANGETDAGLYFSWGGVQGYTPDQVSGNTLPHKDFSWSDYEFSRESTSVSNPNFTKYCINLNYGYDGFVDNKTVLDLVDDAAHVNMGGDWRMPTEDDYNELFDYYEHIQINPYDDTYATGVTGISFTNMDNGNVLFLPFADKLIDGSYYSSETANYWTSTLSTNSNVNYDSRHGMCLFSNGDRYGVTDSRCYRPEGCVVRGIIG